MNKLLTLILALLSTAAIGRETITIMYAWSPNDSVANYHRTLALEANRIQDRYTFVLDGKPGAGGAIASNYALNTPNVLLAHSTAFFVRPNVYPNESYDLSAFKEQFVHCMAPMAVTSSKYRSWNDIAQARRVTVGISGLGVTTHLAALQLQKKYSNIEIIPFKSTSDSMMSMVGGQTDLHIGFISEAEQWSRENRATDKVVNVLGITGTKTVNGYVPLVNQGFPSSFADMNVGHHILVPAKFDAAKTQEFHAIFSRAARAKTVRDSYAVDYCAPVEVGYNDLQNFFNFHKEYWRKMSSGITIQ